jgi:hypothetical protein
MLNWCGAVPPSFGVRAASLPRAYLALTLPPQCGVLSWAAEADATAAQFGEGRIHVRRPRPVRLAPTPRSTFRWMMLHLVSGQALHMIVTLTDRQLTRAPRAAPRPLARASAGCAARLPLTVVLSH